MRASWLIALALALATSSACTVFDEEILPPPPECTTNAECTIKLTGDSATPIPGMCVKGPEARCVQLTSEDCTVVTGNYLDDDAVLIASLLSTTGAQAATNLPRQQAAIMAVEQINSTSASGGILQSKAPGDARKLVMVSCDEIANLPRVATHLVTDLHVTAIVGPNLSQDTLDLTTGNPEIGLPSSAQAGVALLSPTAVASAIATIPDNGLSFMMVPSDIQRVPLMKTRIAALESELKTARSKSTIKIAILYRSDALGRGTADGLASLRINDASLASQISLGRAREDAYDATAITTSDNTALIQSYVAFQPDIVVIGGAAEAIKYFVVPFETAWQAAIPSAPKPYYVTIDSAKTPDLITAVTGAGNDLRPRWSGTGIAASAESQPVLSAFQIAYGQRWRDAMGNPQPATQSGMGPAYDAVYTIALGLVGSEPTAAKLVENMPRLASNNATCTYDASGVKSPCFTVSDQRTLYQNMGMLLDKQNVTEIGTFGRLEWDVTGAKSSGLIELWCIDSTGPKPTFASSGQTYDVKTQTTNGVYTKCLP